MSDKSSISSADGLALLTTTVMILLLAFQSFRYWVQLKVTISRKAATNVLFYWFFVHTLLTMSVVTLYLSTYENAMPVVGSAIFFPSIIAPVLQNTHPGFKENIGEGNYEVEIGDGYPNREAGSLSVYTDGSKLNNSVGAGLFVQRPDEEDIRFGIKLNEYCTVFGTEIFATKLASDLLFTLKPTLWHLH